MLALESPSSAATMDSKMPREKFEIAEPGSGCLGRIGGLVVERCRLEVCDEGKVAQDSRVHSMVGEEDWVVR